MATLDAGAIQEIGNSGFNPMGAKQAAYTLADTIDKQQLQRMGLKDAQQEQQDLAQIKTLSQKYKLDDPEDQNKFAAEAMRVNPKYGMGLMKEFTASQTGRAQLDREQLALLGDKQNIITSGLLPVYMQGKELKAAGKTDAEINAALLPVVSQTFKMLQGTYQKNGKPLLEPNNLQDAQNLLQSGNILGGLQGMLMKNKDSFETLHKLTTEEQAINREKTAEKRELETERHNREVEGRMASAEAFKEKGGAAGAFTSEMGALQAAMIEQGVTMPAGFRGAKQQANILQGLIERNSGKTPDEIATMLKNGKLSLTAATKEANVAGGIAGKIRYAEEELVGLAPKLLEASAAVPRGSFVPWNRLQLYTESQMSDPKLKTLQSYLTTFSNAYDVLGARGGTDVAKREHARALLNAADSPEALQSAIKTILEEAKISGEAAAASERPRGSTNPTPTSAQAAVPPGSTPAASGAGSTPPASALKAGTVTHFANGQNWTLGPDGKPQQVK